MRSSCALSVTHHGSGHPELGAVQHHQGDNGSKLSYSPPRLPTATKWVQAVNTDGTSGQAITYIMSLAGGSGAYQQRRQVPVGGWRKFNTVARISRCSSAM